MNNNWQIKKLGEIFEIQRGGSPRPIESFLTTDKNGINWIKIGDTKNTTKYIYTTAEKIKPEGLKKTRLVNEGDFILSNSMSFGRPYIMKTTGAIHDGWLVLHKKLTDIDIDYFYYLLGSPLVFNQFDRLAAGSTVRNLNTQLVSNVSVLFPTLTEQQRIVKILDEAFEKINKAKSIIGKNLKNSEKILESYLQKTFDNPPHDWERCNLEDYIKLIDYRGRTPIKTESGVRLITAKNVKLGYLQLEPQEFIDPNNYDSWMTRGIPNFGDVIFTTEAPLANVAQLNIADKVAFAQRIIVMQPQLNKINPTFLKYLLLSKPIRNKILSKGTGATVQGIKSSLLKKIEIYFPKSLDKQKEIVQVLNTITETTKKLEQIYKQKLADLEELRKSILNKAFSGEL